MLGKRGWGVGKLVPASETPLDFRRRGENCTVCRGEVHRLRWGDSHASAEEQALLAAAELAAGKRQLAETTRPARGQVVGKQGVLVGRSNHS